MRNVLTLSRDWTRLRWRRPLPVRVDVDAPHRAPPEFRAAALEAQRLTDHEWMLAGPAETGKTFAGLWRIDSLLRQHPGTQAVLLRKVRNDIYGSALQTLAHIHEWRAGDGIAVSAYGGEKPEWYRYSNGSRLWIAGMDRPGKALSSERDVIYINQAEELTLADWETLTTRCTGRAGHVPNPMIGGDCNPEAPHHWIKQRPSLRVLESRHEDNPRLWDAKRRQWTPQGKRTIAILDRLTGTRKQRLRYGRWVSAEGTVYEFDAAVHVLDPFPIPGAWRRLRSIDFGYTNPFACGWWALDPDGRMYLYREIYHTQRTVADHARQIKSLSIGETHLANVADHDAEDRATLEQHGIVTVAANKAISPGVQAVEERLQIAGDGRPRLYVFRNSLVERDESLSAAHHPVCTEQEFDAYVWPKAKDGKPIKEAPVDLFNHGMDQTRYAVMWVNEFLRLGQGKPRVGSTRPAGAPSFKNLPAAAYGGRKPTFRGRI